MTSCGAKMPSLEPGMYAFEKAIIINRDTKEVTEKVIDDIINDKAEYLQWHWLLNFGIEIKLTSEIFTSDDRYFVGDGVNVYEITGKNTLKLYFPHFQSYGCDMFDIVIVFKNQKVYG